MAAHQADSPKRQAASSGAGAPVVGSRATTDALQDIGLLFVAPTRLIMNKWRSGRQDRHQADMIKRWSRGFAIVAASLCGLTGFLHHYNLGNETFWSITKMCVFVLALSRWNETMIAFGLDTRNQLRHNAPPIDTTPIPPDPYEPNRYIPPADWLGLVIQSYIEIWLFCALMFTFLPSNAYGNDIHLHILSAIYFSGVTITTLGYGDIVPVHPVARFLALYEAMSGVFLVVVAIFVYMSQAFRNTNRRP